MPMSHTRSRWYGAFLDRAAWVTRVVFASRFLEWSGGGGGGVAWASGGMANPAFSATHTHGRTHARTNSHTQVELRIDLVDNVLLQRVWLMGQFEFNMAVVMVGL